MISDYNDALTFLEDRIGLGMKPGLDRISQLMERMGNPHLTYPIIHIAGTNGKTSTARMVTEIAHSHGFRTGTFTSPHLERIEERIAIDGLSLSSTEFSSSLSDVVSFSELDPALPLTYFELLTGAGLSYFATEGVGLGIVEVGLGGRLDSTNVVQGAVSVITSIGLDHTDILGSSLSQIAVEKMAIAEPGCPLVVGPLGTEATQIAERTTAELGAELVAWGRDFSVTECERFPEGWVFNVEGIYGTYENLCLDIFGRYQTTNLALALASLEMLVGRELSDQAITEAMSNISIPGRLERISTNPLILVDGAHNRDGYQVLADSLHEEFASDRWVLVTAGMKDKNPAELIQAITDRISAVVATEISGSDRSLSVEELAAQISDVWDDRLELISNPHTAISQAIEMAGEDGEILVAGSLYLGGEIRAFLGGRDRVVRNER